MEMKFTKRNYCLEDAEMAFLAPGIFLVVIEVIVVMRVFTAVFFNFVSPTLLRPQLLISPNIVYLGRDQQINVSQQGIKLHMLWSMCMV